MSPASQYPAILIICLMPMDSKDLNLTENIKYSKFQLHSTFMAEKTFENEIFSQKFIVQKDKQILWGN